MDEDEAVLALPKNCLDSHAETKRTLQNFYQNLVKLEITNPGKFHKGSYLGIKRSKDETVQKEISEASCIETLGEDGIFDDGIPFYHYKRSALTDEQKQRLVNNGVAIKRNQFDSAEDRQIRRNWKSYCKLTGAFHPSEASDIFCEGQKRGQRVSKDPYFYAYMCRGLADRTCAQMVRRAYILFNKAQDKGDGRTWTAMDDIKLQDLAKKHNQQWETIGRKMGRTRFTCYHRYKKLQEKDQVNEDSLAVKALYLQLTKFFGYDALSVALKEKPVIKSYEEKVNWSELAKKCEWTEDKAREYWHTLKRAIRQCSEETASTDPMIIKKALPEDLHAAVLINLTPRAKYCRSTDELANALKILLKTEEEALKEKLKVVGMKDWLKLRFTKSEALSEYDGTKRKLMCRQLYGILNQCETYGLFECLPVEHYNAFTQLDSLHFMLTNKKSDTLCSVNTISQLFLKYIEEKRWTPRTRVFLCHKLDKGSDDVEESEPDGVEATESNNVKASESHGGEAEEEDSEANDLEASDKTKKQKHQKSHGKEAPEGKEEEVSESKDVAASEANEEAVTEKTKKQKRRKSQGEEASESQDAEVSEPQNVEALDSHSVEASEKRKKRKSRKSHGEEASEVNDADVLEEVPEKTKKRKRKSHGEEAPEGNEEEASQLNGGGDAPEKKKKQKRRKSHGAEEALEVNEQEAPENKKKKKRRQPQNSQ
ncbi:unnamed protein product [Bursaphelenchus okinawaensis]|uniref:Myb-like domain-containing protein n=1 Tax=Bursaphelenchus okinawaensis TaxID=465554 RepID=A0A811L529_9BILA|nr:unnamed protein product [Bursaphelenchus okinawaensis]CAG9117626.1 unnamed protein product [Bursaphelenchus okinawaensis]